MSDSAPAPDHAAAHSPALTAAAPAPNLKPRSQRSVFARAADLLVISLVLIVALTVGRQVLEWWHDEPTPPATSRGTPAWGAGEEPVEMTFGEAPGSMTRQVVQGDLQAARVKLADRCAEVTPHALAASEIVDDDERALIETLLKRKAVAEEADAWRVCHLEGPFEVVVGLRRIAGATDAVPRWRVVCWGSVLPLAEGSWALHLYTSRGGVMQPLGASIPLPDGARRMMSLGESGAKVVGFTCSSETECMRFYDQWFAEKGWTSSGWQSGERTWTGRFLDSGGGVTGESGGGQQGVAGTAYVQLTRGDRGVTGLVTYTQGTAQESVRD